MSRLWREAFCERDSCWLWLRGIAVFLWLMVPVPLLSQVLDAAQTISKIADVAEDKSVVWLSLVVAIVAIVFSAWLVSRLLSMQRETLMAIDGLKDELWQKRRQRREDDETPNRR